MAELQQLTDRPPRQRRAVALVDSDIHPVILPPAQKARMSVRWVRHYERYGRRTPHVTDLYPRARNKGMRADSWPDAPGSVPGSDLELMQRQLLDEHEIDIGILNCLNAQDCFDPPGFAAELNRALNDALEEEWMDRDPRLRGAICVPHDHPDLAVAEIERRAGDERWVQVLFPAAAAEPLGSRRYWPIYRAAAEAGLPVAFHTGGWDAHRGAGWPSYYLEEHTGYGVVMQMVLTSLVCDGALSAVPDLKVVLTEGGAAWLPSLRWRLDQAWAVARDEVPEVDRRPSEIIRDQVWLDTQPIEEPDDPQDFARIVELGEMEDRLLFATDYPHWDFDSPAQALPRSLSKAARARILAGNACDLYRGLGEAA
jgi:predicted TIM-barrel fold metal-dependent hydrolase